MGMTEAAGARDEAWRRRLLGPQPAPEPRSVTLNINDLAAKGFNALETERSKLAAVLQKMTDGVLIVNSQGLVQLINPTAEKMFAVQSEKVLNSSLAEVVRQHQIQEMWQRSLDSGIL